MDFEARVAACKRWIRSTSIDGVQRRMAPFSWVQTRAQDDGGFEVVGHAAVFDSLSENLGGFREKIDPGAFAKVLAGNGADDARALFNHDPNLVLASKRNGTLHLAEDDRGLAYRAEVPAGLYYGEALRVLLERGDVDQSSFAFRVARGGDSWDENDDGVLIRTVHEFSALYDVSPVTYPAYPAADSGLAALAAVASALDAPEFELSPTPSPDAERGSDGPSQERATDGGTEEAGGASEGLTVEQTKQRLRLRGARLRA